LTVFAVNRDPDGQPVVLNGDLRAFGDSGLRPVEHLILENPADLLAVNTAERPDNVTPRSSADLP